MCVQTFDWYYIPCSCKISYTVISNMINQRARLPLIVQHLFQNVKSSRRSVLGEKTTSTAKLKYETCETLSFWCKRVPEWRSVLRHCISVQEASLQSLVQIWAVSHLAWIVSPIVWRTIDPATSGVGRHCK